MARYDNILDTIGRTPLVRLDTFAPPGVNLYAKVEAFNPMGSVKDRMALAVIEQAERSGELRPGQTVIEATSGNTGIGLAMVCARKGYPLVVTMAESFSVERRKLLRYLGVRVVLTPAAEKGTGMLAKAIELAERHGYYLCRQFENEANAEVHSRTTAREILDDFQGEVLDCWVSGFGTGGTPSSFTAFGLDSSVRGDVFARHLRIVLDAWAGRSLEGGDKLDPAAPALADRVWQATFSVAGGERAGSAGDGLMLSRTQPRPVDRLDVSLAELQNPIIDAYLEALPEGRTPRVLGSRSLFVADSRKEALRFAEIGLRRGAERLIAAGHKVAGNTLADLIRAFDVHLGTPEEVIESLSADETLNRVTDLVFQVHSVDPPHALILRSLELSATKVAPALSGFPERRVETRRSGAGG